jgi:UDP-N-acetylmuramate dehydrogenase
MKINEGEILAPFTTLKVGGPAKFFADVSSVQELKEVLRFVKAENLNLFVLGGGSNVLISDKGFNGIVIKINIEGIETLEKNDRDCIFRVGAGVVWDDFVKFTVKRNIWGIECLSGIPGSIGASPVQNIGAYGQEVKDTIVSVEAVNMQTSTCRKFDSTQCGFSYRDSYFKKRREEIVTHVTYRLSKIPNLEFKYKELEKAFGNRFPSIWEIRQKVMEIRRSKSMVYDINDINSYSNGSFFINPVINKKQFEGLQKIHQDIPHWPVGNNKMKLAAAWLIENAGFNKGYKHKTTGLSEKHTLAIVNRGSANAKDIYDLHKIIIAKVKDAFGVEISPETQFIGDF